jgi:hypothetical protein
MHIAAAERDKTTPRINRLWRLALHTRSYGDNCTILDSDTTDKGGVARARLRSHRP